MHGERKRVSCRGFVTSEVIIRVFDHAAQRLVCEQTIQSLPMRIGRDPGNDVCLDFDFVSSWHVELRGQLLGELQLCDLGSRNSLKIAGRRLKSGCSRVLELPASATLGPLELRFEVRAPPGQAAGAVAKAGQEIGEELPDFSELAGFSGSSVSPQVLTGELDGDALPSFGGEHEPDFSARIQRIQAARERLRPLHTKLEASRREWQETLIQEVNSLRQEVAEQVGEVAAEEVRDHDMAMLLRSFPAADRGSFAQALAGGVLGQAPELAAVVQAAAELLPGMSTPTNEDETRRFLARVVDVLRVYAAATLEVQHVRRSQSAELGVRWEEPADPLIALETSDEVLRYLLDWRDAGEDRSEELVRSLGALVDHLQGYVKASLMATREVLMMLSPIEIERGAVDRWPSRASALWRHYQSSFTALLGEGIDHLSPAFRAAFARAYRDTLTRAGVPTRPEDPRSKRAWR